MQNPEVRKKVLYVFLCILQMSLNGQAQTEMKVREYQKVKKIYRGTVNLVRIDLSTVKGTTVTCRGCATFRRRKGEAVFEVVASAADSMELQIRTPKLIRVVYPVVNLPPYQIYLDSCANGETFRGELKGVLSMKQDIRDPVLNQENVEILQYEIEINTQKFQGVGNQLKTDVLTAIRSQPPGTIICVMTTYRGSDQLKRIGVICFQTGPQ